MEIHELESIHILHKVWCELQRTIWRIAKRKHIRATLKVPNDVEIVFGKCLGNSISIQQNPNTGFVIRILNHGCCVIVILRPTPILDISANLARADAFWGSITAPEMMGLPDA